MRAKTINESPYGGHSDDKYTPNRPENFNKENIKSGYNEDEVYKYFGIVIDYLQKRIYPKLNDNDLYELNSKLKKWFIKNHTE